MIEKISNHTFKNKELIVQALTHSSFSRNNYERLEFLGDSILDFLVGEYLFKNSEEDEGNLTKFRAQFVSEAHLAKVFDRIDLKNEVLVGKSYRGELSNSIKADIIEALIAAVYLDAGFAKAKKFTYSLINLGNFKTMKNNDYKTQLQEIVQANKQKIEYRTLSKSGQSHNPIFEVGVFIDDELIASAQAGQKHKAEQLCAFEVLKIKKVL
ncbi:MAG: ribonuclease III [Christensenellales bacterium]|jgi:ribonuclease-3